MHYQDFFLRNLFDEFKQAGHYEDTVFVVVGDHGEGFREHGLRFHDNVMYDEGLRVPLLLHWPAGGVAPGRLPGPVSQLSIAPTVLDLLGFDIAAGTYPDGSWRRDEQGGSLHASCHRKLKCMAGVRGQRKLIHYYGDKADELFDLAVDPLERRNLASEHPDEVREWLSELQAWQQRVADLHAPFGGLRLGSFVRERPFEPSEELAVRFGGVVELEGVDTPRRAVRAGSRFPLGLYLRPVGDVEGGTVEVRVTVDDARPWRRTHIPVGGLYPLADWEPGRHIRDDVEIRAPARTKSKTADICVRLFDTAGEPMEVEGAVGPVKDGCAHVATVKVRPRKP